MFGMELIGCVLPLLCVTKLSQHLQPTAYGEVQHLHHPRSIILNLDCDLIVYQKRIN
jgi:hypothetical protein